MYKFSFLLLISVVTYGQYVELPTPGYPLKLIKGYCLADTTKVTFIYQYEYDWKKNIIKYIRDLDNHTFLEEHNFAYNPNGRIEKEMVFLIEPNNKALQSYVLYYYSENNLSKKEYYSASGELLRTEEMDYIDELLMQLNINYFTNGQQRLQSFTKYTYDAKGRLTGKDGFSGTGDLLTSSEREYSADRLVKETETDYNGKEHTSVFEYDSANRLIKKIADGKIVQENAWMGSRLIKRSTYYLGFDPCRNLCCGNTMIRIEY